MLQGPGKEQEQQLQELGPQARELLEQGRLQVMALQQQGHLQANGTIGDLVKLKD